MASLKSLVSAAAPIGGAAVGSLFGAPQIGAALGMGVGGMLTAQDAGELQAEAARRGQDIQMAQYQQARADLEPWRTAGAKSLEQLTDQMPELTRPFAMSDYTTDPGYAFRVSEGENALDRAASARGMLLSPASMRELLRYNSGLASQEFGNAFNRWNTWQTNAYNRLAGVAGTGQTAATQLGQFGAQNAASMADLITGGAAAQAAGQVGGYNALAQGLGMGLNFYNNQQQNAYQTALLRALTGTSGSPTTPSLTLDV